MFHKSHISFPVLFLVCTGLLITNAIAQAGNTYYVSTSGDNTKSGLSETEAWRTITFSAVQAQDGDKVYIKAGNYGEEYVNVANSGTSGNPIVFEGYKNSPGDISEPGPFDIHHEGGLSAPELDPAEMPLIQGTFEYDPGFNISYRSHLELKNIQIENYFEGIWGIDINNITLNNIIMGDCQYLGYDTGYGIHLKNCSDCSILNCVATDCDMTGISIKGARNTLIENCRAHDKPGGIVQDYFLSLTGGSRDSYGNTIRHCFAQNHDEDHGGHGIGLKGEGYNLHNNTFEDCVSRDFDKGFYVRHSNVYDNTFTECNAYGYEGFVVRDGAHDNTFLNCKGSALQNGILFYDTDEDGGQNDCSGRDNAFVNCIFTYCHNGVFFADCDYIDAAAINNTFQNCVFANGTTLIFHETQGNDGNMFQNCIVTGFTNLEDGSGWGNIEISYSDFWNIGFTTPSGTGNIEEDPLFAYTLNCDFHLKSEYGRWNGSDWICDDLTSPCIDAGYPTDDYSNEPSPNGEIINMGAYGNTIYASKSPLTIAATLTCIPAFGTLPFSSLFRVTMSNLCYGQARRFQCAIDVTLAGGPYYSSWRQGWRNLQAGEEYSIQWWQSIPDLPSLQGGNLFELMAADVTPPPYNLPPYPPAGDTATDHCTVTGVAP